MTCEPTHNRRPSLAMAAVLAAALGCVGCQGRAEFARGDELYARGHYRDAYRQYWEAYRLRPTEQYRIACRRAARRVALGELQRAQAFEHDGELDDALVAYSVGLEYDSSVPVLRSGYARVADELERRDRLVHELAGESSGTWRRFDALMELSSSPAVPPVVLAEFGTRARTELEAIVTPLRLATPPGQLPRGRGALLRLRDRWAGFEHECVARADSEERLTASAALRSAEVPAVRRLNAVLDPFVDEARARAVAIEDALRAEAAREQGLRLERAGDVFGALAAYRVARMLRPGLTDVAADESRLRRIGGLETVARARKAGERGDRRGAVEALRELARLRPQWEPGTQLLREAEEALAVEHDESARRALEAGLVATALLHLSTARGLRGGADQSLGAHGDELRQRVRNHVRLDLALGVRRPPAPQERLRLDLWGVDKASIRGLEHTVVSIAVAAGAAVRDQSRELTPGTAGTAQDRVWIEDFEFTFQEVPPWPGFETVREVEGFRLADGDAWVAARSALDEARRESLAADLELERAAVPGRRLAGVRADLARWRVHQLEVCSASLPAKIASVQWRERSVETRHVRRLATLSAFLSGPGGERWVRVEHTFQVKLSVGDGNLTAEAAVAGLPSRERALDDLGRRLGREIAEELRRRQAAALGDLLEASRAWTAAGQEARALECFARLWLVAPPREQELREQAREALEPLVGELQDQ